MFFDRIPAIIRLRVALSTVSVNAQEALAKESTSWDARVSVPRM